MSSRMLPCSMNGIVVLAPERRDFYLAERLLNQVAFDGLEIDALASGERPDDEYTFDHGKSW